MRKSVNSEAKNKYIRLPVFACGEMIIINVFIFAHNKMVYAICWLVNASICVILTFK